MQGSKLKIKKNKSAVRQKKFNKKILFFYIFLLVLSILVLSIFLLNNSDVHPVELNNIKMEIKEGTLTRTGATIVITDLGKEKTIFGECYTIEKKVFNQWKVLKSPDGWCNLKGYTVDENNKLEMVVDWTYDYGKLGNGNYRLIKEVDGEYISVEFTIDENE